MIVDLDGGTGSGASSGSGRGGVASAGVVVILFGEVAGLSVDTAVLGESEAETVVVPAAREEKEREAGDDDEQDIEDTVPDEALGDTDQVAAISTSPSDGVEEPEQVDPAGEGRVVLRGVKTASVLGAIGKGVHGESKVGHCAESEETPLVVGAGVGADEVADDPDPREEDLVEDGGPRDTAQQAEGDDNNGEEDDPADILGPEDLANETLGDMVCLRHRRPAEISSLSEIDDTANQESRDEQVVEDLLASLCCPDESEKHQLVAVSHQLVLKTAGGVFCCGGNLRSTRGTELLPPITSRSRAQTVVGYLLEG